jgi:nucleotide-binding universal stress UspA family protein
MAPTTRGAVPVRNIVVGVDGSDAAWRALAVAIDVALRYHGAVHACFVWPLTATEKRAGFSAAPASSDESDGDEERLRGAVVKALRDAGAEGDFVQREGEIGYELEALASSSDADLIVVGRSRHPTLHLGGVPRQLLGMGRRLVLVVP